MQGQAAGADPLIASASLGPLGNADFYLHAWAFGVWPLAGLHVVGALASWIGTRNAEANGEVSGGADASPPSVRVEPLGASRCRLVLTMSYTTKLGPLGTVLSEMLVIPQYESVFDSMLKAASTYATTGRAVPSVVMPGSGRVLTPA